MTNMLTCFLILCLTWPLNTQALNWTFQKYNTDLARVTMKIARDHLSKYTTTVVINEKTYTPDTNHSNADFLDYLLVNLQGRIAVQFNVGYSNQRLWNHYIFIVDSLNAFKLLRYKFPKNFYERKFFFLIVLTKPTPNLDYVMRKIFTMCYNFEVINANIIVDHPEMGLTMFTYRIFTDAGCRKVQPIVYFRFDDGFENLQEVFIPKLRNFFKCPLRVVARTSPIILTFEGDTNNPQPVGNWENLSGIEGTLLKMLAKELNFTIKLKPMPITRNTAGIITGHGCFNEMMTGHADLAIGAFSSSDPIRWILSATNSFYCSPYVYVVRGEQSLSSLSRLGKPFKGKVWISIASLFTAGAIVTISIRWMKRPVRRFFSGEDGIHFQNFIAVFLGYPVARPPRRNFARYILLLWMYVTLIIRSAYQGSLYHAFRLDNFDWTPSGYDDLLKWNYKVFMPPDIARMGMFPKNRTIVVPGVDFLAQFSEMEASPKRLAAITLRDSYVFYMAQANNRDSNLVMLTEVIYDYRVVMYLAKQSMFLPSINKKLAALESSGLTQYVAKKFTSKTAMFSRIKELPSKNPLAFSRLSGIGIIYLSLSLIAVIAFGLELISKYCQWLRRAFDIIN